MHEASIITTPFSWSIMEISHFFPNSVSLIFWELFAMLCFRLRRLISLSFIYYPGERGKEERKESRRERGRYLSWIILYRAWLREFRASPCTDCRDCFGSITFTKLKSDFVTSSLVPPQTHCKYWDRLSINTSDHCTQIEARRHSS